MEERLRQRLLVVAARLRSWRSTWGFVTICLAAAAVAWIIVRAAHNGVGISDSIGRWWLGAGAAISLAYYLVVRFRRHDLHSVARSLEQRFPTLKQSLLTASGLSQQEGPNRFGFLEQNVIREAIRHDVTHQWTRLVSGWSLAFARLAALGAIVLAVAAGRQLWDLPAVESSTALLEEPDPRPLSEVPIITPGDTEIERGSNLIVTGRFEMELPESAALVVDHASQAESQEIAMRRSMDDPVYAAFIYGVKEPLEYQIRYDGEATRKFKVSVFDYPALVRADAHLSLPTYAGDDAKIVQDTRRVSVPQGTTVQWQLYLNKPVRSARLVREQIPDGSTTDPDDNVIELSDSPTDPKRVQGERKLEETHVWRLELEDADGRTNPSKVTLRAKVLPNDPAAIRLASGGDAVVSPLEEFSVTAKVSDDFELTATGIGYQFGGGDLIEMVSQEGSDSTTRQKDVEHLIAFEELSAEPNQLLSYYVWAEDKDDDGSTRRTVSDMYFVEVRPFDEIYRQGQQPTDSQQQQSQQQGQQGNQQTEELLEMQKQIVIASWNILREANEDQLIGRSIPDVVMLAETQQSAVQLLDEKAAEANVPGAETIVASARANMQAAIEHLESTADSRSKEEMLQAISAEQAAYQDLLRLQSREHEIVRSQRSQSSQQSQSQRARNRQQQIDELKIENEENRYENQRLAQDQESEQQSELRQVMSRLRELAARQDDINDQLREIQAALESAEDEVERDELEKQLERLREQQQQMLEDSDELQERLADQSSEEMRQSQDQLEQARENLQNANEAMQRGDIGQSLASGTRAQQQLDELEEEVRQQAAGQFEESMRQLQRQAENIVQRQDAIIDQLDDDRSEPTAGLRKQAASSDTKDLLNEQQAELDALLQEMQETVENAEEAEPLLAQKLYDSYRRTQQQRVPNKLDDTQQLVTRGFDREAQQLARETVEELSMLREDIDEAAESVLGSEVESLRRAAKQLERLSDEIEDELRSATGQSTDPQQQPGQQQPGQQQPGQQQPGQQQPGQQQPGQQQPGQQQPGQQQPGQQQPGQQQPGQQQSGQQQPGQQQPGQAQPGGGLLDLANGGRDRSGGGGNRRIAAPLTGDDFRDWSDRMRDVEELVSDPELRWEATQIRQRAREMRGEFKRTSAPPRWAEVEDLIANPLRDLERKVSQELLRRVAKTNELVPIDRDPVPSEFQRSVELYYENLGSEQ